MFAPRSIRSESIVTFPCTRKETSSSTQSTALKSCCTQLLRKGAVEEEESCAESNCSEDVFLWNYQDDKTLVY